MAKIKSGDVIQIALPKDLGFVYGVYINALDYSAEATFSDLILIFNIRWANPIDKINELINYDYILPPLFVAGLIPTIRKKIWGIVGKIDKTIINFNIPHFRRNEAWHPRDNRDDKWYYCIGANSTNKVKTTYDKVKHLSDLAADGTGIIETKIAMAFLIKEGKNVGDYFEMIEYYEKAAYERVMESPLYFQLPRETRDW